MSNIGAVSFISEGGGVADSHIPDGDGFYMINALFCRVGTHCLIGANCSGILYSTNQAPKWPLRFK